MTNTQKIITLSNGLRIITQKIENAKTCSLGAWVASGSGYETPETSGFSHFIEHILFRGTHTRSALDIAVEMDEIGGILNAYTAKEMTCFYAHTLSEHAPKALDIICDMLMNPKLDKNDVELEKGVIKEEIALYNDSPEDLCADTFYKSIWNESMLGSNILGTEETVDSVTREKLVAHLNKFYVPERMVISIGGNFDEETMLNICRKYFSEMVNTDFPLNPDKAGYFSGITTVKRKFMQNQLIIGFPGIPLGDKRRESSLLISSILGSASSSRLFQHLREKLGLVYSVDSFSVSYLKSGVFAVNMGLNEKSEKQAIRETLRIISEFSKTVTEKELSRAKEQAVAGFVMDLESISARASRNGRNLLLYGKVIPDDDVIKNIRSVTLDDIRKTADEIFDFSKISLCVAGKTKTKKTYKEILDI